MKYLLTLTFLISTASYANKCAEDTKKFCPGVDPGRGQIARCLSDYANEVTPECLKEMKSFEKKVADMNPCYQDLAEFCTSVPNGKLQYCLLKNEKKLSPKCSSDFKKKKGNIIVQDVCSQDIVENCYSTITEPEGSTLKCLIKSRSNLSGFCGKAIDKRVAQMKKNNPCYDEIEKHCPTQIRFIDIQECMEKKVSALTPACKVVINKETKKGQDNACYKDLLRHCRKGLSVDEQHRCLLVNEKELSMACKKKRQNDAQKVEKMISLCESDRLKFCSKVPQANGAVLKCLKENKKKIDKKCSELLK
jgi:Fe-S cluster biosynthesis and repair protein YggX